MIYQGELYGKSKELSLFTKKSVPLRRGFIALREGKQEDVANLQFSQRKPPYLCGVFNH